MVVERRSRCRLESLLGTVRRKSCRAERQLNGAGKYARIRGRRQRRGTLNGIDQRELPVHIAVAFLERDFLHKTSRTLLNLQPTLEQIGADRSPRSRPGALDAGLDLTDISTEERCLCLALADACIGA